MKTIDLNIKEKKFPGVYLLYGEEVYLKRQYRDKLLAALTLQGDTMNFSAYQGKDINPGELIDLAETLPFFAEKRVILVEDSGFFKTTCDALAEYFPQVNETTCFIFVESEVDKRGRTYKAVKKSGSAVEFIPQTESVLTRWVLGRIKRENKNITQPVLSMFFERTGFDMSNIDRELEKLLCYTLKKDVIEAEDVKAVVTEKISNKIFDMVDAISAHNQKKALDLYYDLLTLKEAPMRILFLITRQFRILAEVKELTGKGYPRSEIAKKVGVPEFAVGKYQNQNRNYTKDKLIQVLKDGAAAEEDVKTGKMNEKIAVEIFIVKYSKAS